VFCAPKRGLIPYVITDLKIPITLVATYFGIHKTYTVYPKRGDVTGSGETI
jgi:hypothetical protein